MSVLFETLRYTALVIVNGRDVTVVSFRMNQFVCERRGVLINVCNSELGHKWHKIEYLDKR